MRKVCDICGKKTGFMIFHCKDAMICKSCYKVVSHNFTTTIVNKTLSELKNIYAENSSPIDIGEDGFSISKKISTFLLIDEIHQKFCVPSNYNITKQYNKPKIYRFCDIDNYEIICNPMLSLEELNELTKNRKSNTIINHLSIRLHLTDSSTHDIIIIPKSVRSFSFAFRYAYCIAVDIIKELENIYHTV